MIMRNSMRSCLVTCLPDLSNKKGRDDDTYCVVEESDPCGRYVRYKEILGKGAFKTVYRAFDEVEGIEVAWNQIKVHDALHTAEDLERLYSEVHLLKSLKHKNIIKLYHSWLDTTAKNLNFITEIFTSGTLRQYRKRHKQVDIKAVKSWCRQILRGLLYLHSHDPPIIHRDLKCDNIFVNGNQGEVKIGDLGLAAILPKTHAAHSVIGTPEFMAPEVYEEEYTELIDVYAFGMCLLEMVTSEYPYSECTNAAQIYKKVTLGKKPAALNKVNDPELREFVEKCLATVSSRLSVRELLRDPFLYCDGGCKATDCLPPVGSSIATADHKGEPGALLGNVLCRPSSVNRGLSNFESCPKLPQIHQAPMLIREPYLDPKTIHERSFATSPVKGLPSSHLKEGNPVRNVDLKVKGKRRANGTLYLRLRIADTEDQIRVIHFPFDVEADTAMCVATEMVAELDLANQDVTRIADLIDAALVFMVPGWRPGVAIDEACSEVDHHLCETPIYSEYPNLDEATVPSESSSLDHSRHDPMPWGCSSVKGVDLPSQTEGMVHGRFEELTYHHRMPEPLSRQGEEQCTDSSVLSEESCDWEAVDESSSSVSPSAGSDTIFTSSPKRECKRNTEFKSNDIGEVLNLSEVDHCGVHTDNINRNYEDTQGIFSALESAAEIHEEDDKSALASEELKELARKYELELRELQRKHEEDLLQLRNRWQQKRGLSYSLPKMQQCDTAPTKHLRRSESEKQLTNKHS